MKLSNLKVGDVVRIVLEDHNVPSIDDVDGPELIFEAFGRVVKIHPRSIVLQTWGYPPDPAAAVSVDGRKLPKNQSVTIDKNTEMLRIMKADILKVRKLL